MAEVLGKGTCPICGCREARVSLSKSSLGVIVCPPIHEGGCNTQVFTRSERSTKLAAERVHTWSNDSRKAALVGDRPKGRKPAAKPAEPMPAPEPRATPEPAPKPAEAVPPPKPAEPESQPLINLLLGRKVV